MSIDTLMPAALTWEESAVCRTVDPELFFPEQGSSTLEARRVCAACPVTEECLAAALAAERGLAPRRRHGIWGGLSPGQRALLDPALPSNAEADDVDEPGSPSSESHPGGHELAACGSETAVRRHLRRSEELDPKCAAWRAEHPPRPSMAVCGTDGGYHRHIRRGETTCAPCRKAHRAAATGQ